MKKLTATLAALTLTLAGCATGEQDTMDATAAAPEPTPEETEAPTSDRWAFDYYGGYGEFNLPSENPTGEWAQSAADYREEAGLTDAIYWTTIEADNMGGTDDFNVSGLIFVTADGQQVSSVDWINDLISEAQDQNDDTDFYNQGVDLSNELNDSIKPGAKGEIPIAFTEQVDPVRVYVSDGMSSDLEAYPSDGERPDDTADTEAQQASVERTDGSDASFMLGAYAIDESTGYLDAYHGDIDAEEVLITTGIAMCEAGQDAPTVDESILRAAEVGRSAGFTDEESSIIYGASVTTYCPTE